MKKEHCVYNGEFLIDTSNPHFTENNNFTLDILEKIFGPGEGLFEEDEEDDYDAMALVSRHACLTDSDGPCNEWKVFHNGRWVDTVFFDQTMSADEARYELVTVDQYPSDILLLKVEK